jgi:hypothetical protein
MVQQTSYQGRAVGLLTLLLLLASRLAAACHMVAATTASGGSFWPHQLRQFPSSC